MDLLLLDHLSLSTHSKLLLDDTSFHLAEGDLVLLTGKNGVGKSTLVKALLNDPQLEGENIALSCVASFAGKNVGKNFDNLHKQISYVSQNDSFAFDTVLDCLVSSIIDFVAPDTLEKAAFAFVKENHLFSVLFPNDEKVKIRPFQYVTKRLLKRFSFDRSAPTQEEIKTAIFLERKVNRLSGGQKKMVNNICGLIKYPFAKLCIFDEPINNLDFANVRIFSNLLTMLNRKYPKTAAIVISHCRCLPAINKAYYIENQKINLETSKILCNSCFGTISDGLYL